MSAATVSVIIPAFNCASWIRDAVDSVLAQSHPPLEIIVVDDGSTDATASILASYGKQIRYIHQVNQGVAVARNTGLAAANGEFIAFLDSDDAWHPLKLELQLRAIGNRPEIGLLGTDRFNWPAQKVPPLTDGVLPAAVAIFRDDLAVRNCFTASSVLMRREMADRVGPFDVTLSGPEDHDYWLRVADVSSVAIIPLPLTGYRSVPGSLSKCAVSMEAGMRRILRKLDASDYWRGNGRLRRRAYGYADYACAYMYGAVDNQPAAIARLLGSFAWYPLPFHRRETGVSFGRVRRLVVALLRLAGVMRPESVP